MSFYDGINSALFNKKSQIPGYIGSSSFFKDKKLTDYICNNMQPIYKHAYIGEFPKDHALNEINWLIKNVDRPKIDVEYQTQVRGNVNRHFPIKTTIGDLTLTLWDDINHKSINTIQKYFEELYIHSDITKEGKMAFKDVFITEFSIYDLSVEDNKCMKYTFFNAQLASFDFDQHDSEDDQGVLNIQVTFKIEGYKMEESSPPSLPTAMCNIR